MEPAPLEVCANLYINSRKERRDKEEAERQRQLEEKETKEDKDAIKSVGTANQLGTDQITNNESADKTVEKVKQSTTGNNMNKSQKPKRTTFNATHSSK